VAELHPPGTTSLSDRAQRILWRADDQAVPADLAEALDIVQEAIDQAREHLTALSVTLEGIAAELARRRV
jgi:hypothetical protein